MTPAKLRAPEEHGGILIEPPPQDWPSIIEANARQLKEIPLRFCNLPLRHWRQVAQQQVRGDAQQLLTHWGLSARLPDAPCLVTGHQPELFHPGVWAKHFALGEASQILGLAPIDLIADHDQPKTLSLRVPTATEQGLAVTWIPFFQFRPGLAWEEYVLPVPTACSTKGTVPLSACDSQVSPSCALLVHLERLMQRVQGLISNLLPDAIFPQFVADIAEFLSSQTQPFRLADALAGTRRRWEERWGYRNGELYVSCLCNSEVFLAFVAELIGQLPRFLEAHNAELLAFRREQRLRSRTHPVPLLERDGEWYEAPLWVWRNEQPRQRLWVRISPQAWTFRMGESGPGWQVAPVLNPDELRGWNEALQAAGWKIRPRAVTLTLFVRLFVADLFIHGIGGGLYDRFTDRLLWRCWQITPPRYAVVSATLRLPLPYPTKPPWRREEVLHRLRDCRYNPDRVLPEELLSLPEVRSQIDRKRALLSQWTQADRQMRCDLHHQLAQIRAALRPLTGQVEQQCYSALQAVADYQAQMKLVRDRGWAFVFYSERALTELVERIRGIYGALR
ncbi:MAG: hypothetical protein RMI91_03690 [Gemmatales bacterium]|nr:hypothetical protein [Gemmatales bacterium]MDW7993734.1 hypothetical protein [Gemmatales bacterium]